MLRIFNSFSKKKEDFKPINPNEVRMYVCGMTVYDHCHLGHGRVLVVFDLINRGLHPRPGFKYGTKWRCYDTILGESHAPWLVVHPDNGPVNWEEACLASRLAAGVNKKWLYPIENEGWSYLSITRPPADSRWNNPNRR